MAEPTNIPAQSVETTTYTGLSATDADTDTYPYPTDPHSFPTWYDYSGTWIATGVILCLIMSGLIVVAIVLYKRIEERKARYGQMGAHYRDGGLPPWATEPVGVDDGSIKSSSMSPQGAYPEDPERANGYSKEME